MTNYRPRLFRAYASLFPDPLEDESSMRGIPQSRRDYILRYKFPRDRRLGLCAWRLLESVLRRYGRSAEEIYIGEQGKPLCHGIYFNLSHSAEMAVCGVGSGEIGVDVEKCENAPFDICEAVFTKGEREYIQSAAGPEEKTRRFFRLWTVKESFMKMTGMGLSISPRDIEINVSEERILFHGVTQDCCYFAQSCGAYEIASVVSRKRGN